MQEADVSIRIAIYNIVNGLISHNVTVSIDGVHIKTSDILYFDIWKFLYIQSIYRILRIGKCNTEYEQSWISV